MYFNVKFFTFSIWSGFLNKPLICFTALILASDSNSNMKYSLACCLSQVGRHYPLIELLLSWPGIEINAQDDQVALYYDHPWPYPLVDLTRWLAFVWSFWSSMIRSSWLLIRSHIMILIRASLHCTLLAGEAVYLWWDVSLIAQVAFLRPETVHLTIWQQIWPSRETTLSLLCFVFQVFWPLWKVLVDTHRLW